MLRPLPRLVAPFRDETITSYLHRLAGPNHIDPAGLRCLLAGSDRTDDLYQEPGSSFGAFALQLGTGYPFGTRDAHLRGDIAGIDARIHPVYRHPRSGVAVPERPE